MKKYFFKYRAHYFDIVGIITTKIYAAYSKKSYLRCGPILVFCTDKPGKHRRKTFFSQPAGVGASEIS